MASTRQHGHKRPRHISKSTDDASSEIRPASPIPIPLSPTSCALHELQQQQVPATQRSTDYEQQLASASCVMLTGGTGFLGKAIIRDLLSAHPNASLLLVIRPKYGTPGETRVNKLLAELFPEHEVEDARKRTKLIEGNLKDAHFWASSELQQAAHGIVTHIIHSAASVRFDDPLPEAIQTNVHPLLALHKFASVCGPQLRSMVHVSTAYVSESNQGNEIHAKAVPPFSPTVMELIKPMLVNLNNDAHTRSPAEAAEEAEALRKPNPNCPYISREVWEGARGHHPNTYTFSKALGESLLTQQHNELRSRTFTLKIVRPSIISSALDHHARGNQSFAALNAVVAAVCCGYLHAVNMSPTVQLNVVPVDRVARVVLYTSGLASVHQTRATQGSNATIQMNEVEVVHATSDIEHSICIDKMFIVSMPLVNHVTPGTRSPSLAFFDKPTFQFKLLSLLDCLPFMAVSYFGWGPARRKASQMLHALQSINDSERGLGFFVKPYRFKPSEAATQAGLLDYDVEGYYSTITKAVLSSLESKGIIRKREPADAAWYAAPFDTLYRYVCKWLR